MKKIIVTETITYTFYEKEDSAIYKDYLEIKEVNEEIKTFKDFIEGYWFDYAWSYADDYNRDVTVEEKE